MSSEERAKQYAAMFTHLGRKWRQCVPVDGSPDRARDRMLLDGVTIERPDDSEVWRIVAPTELATAGVPS